MSDNDKPDSERFKAVRLAKGWSFAQAAVHYLVSESSYRRWEKGGNASPVYIEKLERLERRMA